VSLGGQPSAEAPAGFWSGRRRSRVRQQAFVSAAIDRVWDFVILPERMPEWNGELAEVRDVCGPMDRVGGGYRQVWRFMGRRLVAPGLWQVVAIDPMRHRVFRGVTPMGPVIGQDWFDSVDDGTVLTIEAEYEVPLGPFGVVVEPLMRRMFTRTTRRNAQLLDALLAVESRRPS
jgi:hypothetical protein